MPRLAPPSRARPPGSFPRGLQPWASKGVFCEAPRTWACVSASPCSAAKTQRPSRLPHAASTTAVTQTRAEEDRGSSTGRRSHSKAGREREEGLGPYRGPHSPNTIKIMVAIDFSPTSRSAGTGSGRPALAGSLDFT